MCSCYTILISVQTSLYTYELSAVGSFNILSLLKDRNPGLQKPARKEENVMSYLVGSVSTGLRRPACAIHHCMTAQLTDEKEMMWVQ